MPIYSIFSPKLAKLTCKISFNFTVFLLFCGLLFTSFSNKVLACSRPPGSSWEFREEIRNFWELRKETWMSKEIFQGKVVEIEDSKVVLEVQETWKGQKTPIKNVEIYPYFSTCDNIQSFQKDKEYLIFASGEKNGNLTFDASGNSTDLDETGKTIRQNMIETIQGQQEIFNFLVVFGLVFLGLICVFLVKKGKKREVKKVNN